MCVWVNMIVRPGVVIKSLMNTRTKRDKQAETSLFVSFYPTNNRTNAVLERIYKEIRSIFILKANPKQSAENIRH